MFPHLLSIMFVESSHQARHVSCRGLTRNQSLGLLGSQMVVFIQQRLLLRWSQTGVQRHSGNSDFRSTYGYYAQDDPEGRQHGQGDFLTALAEVLWAARRTWRYRRVVWPIPNFRSSFSLQNHTLNFACWRKEQFQVLKCLSTGYGLWSENEEMRIESILHESWGNSHTACRPGVNSIDLVPC